MEGNFNTTTYSIILAKMMLVQKNQWNIEINDFEKDAEKAIRMVYVNSFRPALDNISKEYKEFEEVLTNYDNSILNGDPYPKSYTDAFDKIAIIQKDKPELKESVKYNVLMAGTLANVYDYEYLNSINVFLNPLEGKEILGLHENSILATALYYCDYNNNMKALTKENYYKLLAEGFGQNAQKNIENFDEKNKFIKDYSNLIGEFTDTDSLRQKPEDAKTYMKYFAEISKYVNMGENELLQFIVFCLDVYPELLYKSNNIITSDDFNRIFDQYIEIKPEEQVKAIVSKFNGNVTDNVLMEFATESQLNPKALMTEMQWNEVGNHFKEIGSNLKIEGFKKDDEQKNPKKDVKKDIESKAAKQNAKKEENQTIIKEIEGFNIFKKYFSKYEFLFNEKKLIIIGFIGVILLVLYLLTFSIYAGRYFIPNTIKSAIVNLINNPIIIGYAFLFSVLLLPLKGKKEKMQSIAQITIVITQLFTIGFALDYTRGISRFLTPIVGLIMLVYFVTIFFTDKRFINNNIYLITAALSIISGVITMFIRGSYMETSVVFPTILWFAGNIMVIPYFYNLYYKVEVGKKLNLKNIIKK